MPPVTVPSLQAGVTSLNLNEQQRPRIVLYHQTHHEPNGTYISLLPLLTCDPKPTHVILGAFHLNSEPGHITLNNDPPFVERNAELWPELQDLQANGVAILGMLGGAAPGTFDKLDSPVQSVFESYYTPLKNIILETNLSGIDIDVEEPMSQRGIMRLISRFRADFGPNFIITLAPVAAAMLPGRGNMSGFNYFDLHRQLGYEIAWYNCQFYNGWGDVHTTVMYDAIIAQGWERNKIVVGLLTNPRNGHGYTDENFLRVVLPLLAHRTTAGKPDDQFGGIFGWEYFNAQVRGGSEGPWEWVERFGRMIGYGSQKALPNEVSEFVTRVIQGCGVM